MTGDAQSSMHDEEPSAPVCRAGDEPIPGYRLLEPLGKGGFGEVWKCQAPGGFAKAIKFVQGSASVMDEEQASLAQQEVQAIEFIKNIRHPFILTVERAELRQGTLLIVMELADRSLADLLKECREHGERGIARAELLNYLAEAAEALDLMNFQHGLQHLDVKPQNLFLVGSHVKVADFGLVNRLPEVRGSDPSLPRRRAGGVTPRYVAPEILQQRISRRSDQYSLAIVYQELLTGELPFKGRSARQLILQHAQALPDLAALSEVDRGPVGRALAKDPDERFASCRDFIQALRRAGGGSGAIASLADGARTPAPAAEITPGPRAATPPTNPVVHLRGKAALSDYSYNKLLGQTPLGEVWQIESADGEIRWAYHLQGFARESAEEQEKALSYLQGLRHVSLLRFKIAEMAPHRIVLVFEPWGPSLAERGRAGKLTGTGLVQSLAEAAHAVDELTALTNLEHLALSPDTIVQGLDREQLRDFGLISLLWKSGQKPLDALNLRYGAPELAQGKSSPASDQYSLAASYADLRSFQITGKPWPSPRSSGKSRATGIELTDIPIVERNVIKKALDSDPERRFASCVELVNALAKAQGGQASQTTTAVQSALAATQQSFLSTVHEWIDKQEQATEKAAQEAAAADGSLRQVALIEIVPGTARLRLEVFRQEWQAQVVSVGDHEFRYFIHLDPSLWQRLLGKQVGVSVHVVLNPADTESPHCFQATVVVRPHNCSRRVSSRVVETIAPEVARSVLKALNAVGERRFVQRLPCQADITIRYRPRGGQPTEFQGQVINISRNGVGFVTKAPLDPAAEIRVLLGLPQDAGQPVAVMLKARVRRCDEIAEQTYEVGAEFLRDQGGT
jgi:serine/threonine protein kinase